MTTKTTKTTKTAGNVASVIAAAVQGILSGAIKAEGIKGEAAATALRNVAAAAKAAGRMTEAQFKAAHGEGIAAAVKALKFGTETVGEGKRTNTAWCLGSVFVACANGWTVPAEVARNFQKAAAAARDFNVKGGFDAAPNGEKGGRPKTAAKDAAPDGAVRTADATSPGVESPLSIAARSVFPQDEAAQAALCHLVATDRKGFRKVVMELFEAVKPKNK